MGCREKRGDTGHVARLALHATRASDGWIRRGRRAVESGNDWGLHWAEAVRIDERGSRNPAAIGNDSCYIRFGSLTQREERRGGHLNSLSPQLGTNGHFGSLLSAEDVVEAGRCL